MARVANIKEKVHAPLYDAIFVPEGQSLGAVMTDRMIRFFVDVQNKTRLETNQLSSSVLPSLNSFEARVMRVIPQPVGFTLDDTEISPQDFMAALIYNSVTTLVVGEKESIGLPTFCFPSGGGVDNVSATNHGEPDPMATFRFAEPVIIESQQNFRVEILFPQGVPAFVGNAPGPFRIWVLLDGYLTRDVQ